MQNVATACIELHLCAWCGWCRQLYWLKLFSDSCLLVKSHISPVRCLYAFIVSLHLFTTFLFIGFNTNSTWCGDRVPGEGDVEGWLVSQRGRVHPPADEEAGTAAEQHSHHQQDPERGENTQLRPFTHLHTNLSLWKEDGGKYVVFFRLHSQQTQRYQQSHTLSH